MLIFLSQTIQWSQNDSIQLPWSEVARRSKTDSRGSTQTPAICFNHVQSKVRLNQALNQIICYDQLNVSWPVFLNSKRQWLAVDDLKSQHCTHRTSWYLTISIYFHPRRLHSLLRLLHLHVNKYQLKLFCNFLSRARPYWQIWSSLPLSGANWEKCARVARAAGDHDAVSC